MTRRTTTHALEVALNRHASDVSVHEVTDADEMPELVAQFQLNHRIDRPYDEIRSTVRLDHRGRLITAELRPGPVRTTNWSRGQVERLLEDAVSETEPPFDARINVKNHHGRLWRTHVDAQRPPAPTGDALDWIVDFFDAYRQLYEERRDTPPNHAEHHPDCFDCEERPARHAFTARVTANDELHVLLCTRCARDGYGELPFVERAMDRDFPRRVGTALATAEDFHVLGSLRWHGL